MATTQIGPTAYTLTLDGSIQRLSDVYPADIVESSLRLLTLQAGGANANPIYLGGAAVSSADHGCSIPAGSGGVPAAPLQLNADEAQLFLSDLYVIGTNAQTLHLVVIPTNPVR